MNSRPQLFIGIVVYWEHSKSTCTDVSDITVRLLNDLEVLLSSKTFVPAYKILDQWIKTQYSKQLKSMCIH